MTLYKWSQTAASNATIDSTINWAEGMAPSAVNDSSRSEMAAVAKYRDDNSGVLITGGSSTALTLATNQGLSSLIDGFSVVARIGTTTGAAPTLNVDSLGAKAIRTSSGAALYTGGMLAGATHKFTYDSADDCWYVSGYFTLAPEFPSGTRMTFQQTAAPTGWTKDATLNDRALRIVSGSVVGGGSVAFSTAFASQAVGGTVGNTSLSEAQLAAHKHFTIAPVINGSPSPSASTQVGQEGIYGSNASYNLAGTASAASVGLSSATGGGETHTHTFSGNAINLAVLYTDLIVAQKN